MSHRKETKQQPGTAGPGNIVGCWLVYLHFLCDIHSVVYQRNSAVRFVAEGTA